MAMFRWNEALLLGIEEIDTQHQQLFALGEAVHCLLRARSEQAGFDELLKAIEELAAYTDLHFKTEARLFAQHAYPDAAVHELEHHMFLEYLKTKDLALRDENREEDLKDLLKFFALWLFKHINGMDFKYKEYLIGGTLKSE